VERSYFRINADGLLERIPELSTAIDGSELVTDESTFYVTKQGIVWYQNGIQLFRQEGNELMEFKGLNGSTMAITHLVLDKEEQVFVQDTGGRILKLDESRMEFRIFDSPLTKIERMHGFGTGLIAYGKDEKGKPSLISYQNGNWRTEILDWDFSVQPLGSIFSKTATDVCLVGKTADYACSQNGSWQITKTAKWPWRISPNFAFADDTLLAVSASLTILHPIDTGAWLR